MTKREDEKKTGAENPDFKGLPHFFQRTALDYLAHFPVVTGHEVDTLVEEFKRSADRVAQSPELLAELFETLKDLNPKYQPAEFSKDGKANVLANVVAAIYAPIIHNFNLALLKNISLGKISGNVLAPPRDTIPFVHSLNSLAAIQSIPITIFTPYINRHTAGIHNNQTNTIPVESPYLRRHFAEVIEPVQTAQDFTEIEPGIYSTLSLKVSQMLKELGHSNLAALKLYGLGPNLSYIHAVLCDGEEWVAEEAERKGLVDPEQIAGLMILLDSIEEFGMQNEIESVEYLTVNGKGKVEPKTKFNNEAAREIAAATNRAVLETATFYEKHDAAFMRSLLSKVPEMEKMSREKGFPLTLGSIIPPDDKKVKLAHFERIRRSGLLHYPKGLSL